MTVARDLAEFLVATKTADLPAQTTRHAAMIIASTIASAAYGSGIESARIIRDLAREQGGRPDASLWFDAGARLPVAEVARANAMLSDAAASDDSDLRANAHIGTQLTAVSLALGERIGATGAEVLTAMVLGYEAAGRISEPISPAIRLRGFHGCHCAIFGAAVAAARLLRLNAAQMAQSIAISATSIGGLNAAANTSLAREYHAGLAALLGVNAAVAGMATRDLGGSWDIVTDVALKLMPGGHLYHGFAEAAANAAREGDIAAADIESITIARAGFNALSGKLHPSDLIQMAHSPAYFAAAGAAERMFSWVHASDAKIADPVIHGLINKVRVGPAPTDNASHHRYGATVTIRTHDGRSVTNTVHMPKGSGALGIAWSDVDEKYRALVPASGLPPGKIEESLAMIHDFHRLATVSPLIALLRTGTA
jgi:2-methylcitrate dehydratase PrpD